jgi:cytochrome c551/c552
VTDVPTVTYTYSEIGDFGITVEVSDPDKLTAKSPAVSVYAGNAAPTVTIDIIGNKSFYFPNKKVEYKVSVNDSDDASDPDMSNIFVSADYTEGSDLAEASVGHQQVSDKLIGKNMMSTLDCNACHKESEKSIGPAYLEVAKKYEGDDNAPGSLATKIINGGAGVWGETMMPAHADLKEGDAKSIVAWILSLADEGKTTKSLPPAGSLKSTLDKKPSDHGMLIITASYTDKGSSKVKPLTTTARVGLKSNTMDLMKVSHLNGYTTMEFNSMSLLLMPNSAGAFQLGEMDLTGVTGIEILSGGRDPMTEGYSFEIHLDGVDGQLIGSGLLKPAGTAANGSAGHGAFKIEPVTDGKLHEVFVVSKPIGNEEATGAIRSVVLKAD